jgi:hypothetical protein
MSLSPPVVTLLAAVDALSGSKLTRRDDLGVVLEAAYRSNREEDLDELSFQAKFTVRAFGIMRRIGSGAEGYDRLSTEFESSLAKAKTLLGSLAGEAEAAAQAHFRDRYLSPSIASLEELIALFRDLSWYKNWKIDHPGVSPWTIPSP